MRCLLEGTERPKQQVWKPATRGKIVPRRRSFVRGAKSGGRMPASLLHVAGIDFLGRLPPNAIQV
jgi:hypothetical protein